jgi:hypothetical protein
VSWFKRDMVGFKSGAGKTARVLDTLMDERAGKGWRRSVHSMPCRSGRGATKMRACVSKNGVHALGVHDVHGRDQSDATGWRLGH